MTGIFVDVEMVPRSSSDAGIDLLGALMVGGVGLGWVYIYICFWIVWEGVSLSRSAIHYLCGVGGRGGE